MISLVMRRGPTPGEVYTLEGDEITIGRGNRNQIIIRDNEVSRDHCRLVRCATAYEVHDLGASNGTFVNGQRVIAPRMLELGSLIELGDSITLEYGVERSALDGVPDYVERLMANGHMPTIEGSEEKHTDRLERYCLMMLQGPAANYIYTMEGESVSIGRDLSNDIVIQDPEVSRFHLHFNWTKRGYTVVDVGSTNGTFVNDAPVREAHLLNVDDVIRLGSFVQMQLLLVESPDIDMMATMMKHPADFLFVNEDTPNSPFPVKSIVSSPPIVSDISAGSLLNTVFIAYAREDWQHIVAPLMISLQDAGLDVWAEQYLTMGSDAWRSAIQQALQETWLMILVVSPHALSSSPVRTLYRHFLKEHKPITLFLYDTTMSLPADLARLRSIPYDPLNAQRSYHKLIFEVMQNRPNGRRA